MSDEKLTDLQRLMLGEKASRQAVLRIIDGLRTQVAELTRERDEVRAELEGVIAEGLELKAERDEARDTAAVRQGQLEFSRSEVARLTRERDEAQESAVNNSRGLEQSIQREEATALEVIRLRKALAAAERNHVESQENGAREAIARKAAEARVRELEAEISKMQSAPADMLERAIAVESRLAAANALLDEWRNGGDRDPYVGLRDRTDTHLAAQPATAPTRTEAERRVLDAMENLSDQQLRFTRFNGGCLGAVAAAELARREGK